MLEVALIDDKRRKSQLRWFGDAQWKPNKCAN